MSERNYWTACCIADPRGCATQVLVFSNSSPTRLLQFGDHCFEVQRRSVRVVFGRWRLSSLPCNARLCAYTRWQKFVLDLTPCGPTELRTRIVMPKPLTFWVPDHRRWLLPLYFVLSIAWSLELCGLSLSSSDRTMLLTCQSPIRVTHLEGESGAFATLD